MGVPLQDEQELRDVNERLIISSLHEQAAAEASEGQRRQLSALLEALHEGVVIADGDGRIVMLNAAARSLMEIAPHASVLLDDLTTLDYRRLDGAPLLGSDHPLTHAVRGEEVADTDVLLVWRSGEVRRVVVSCTSTRDDGKVTLAIMVLHDVTGAHQLEERLAQAERLAAIGTLAAGVAHEINNPLVYVSANLELAVEAIRAFRDQSGSGLDGEIEAMLQDVQLGAERIRKIVRGLSTFARPGRRATERRRCPRGAGPIHRHGLQGGP